MNKWTNGIQWMDKWTNEWMMEWMKERMNEWMKHMNKRMDDGSSAWIVGRGGALVKSMTINRRVVGSTPALAATKGPWASPLVTAACAFRRELRYSICA